jgi:hypothetical protein
MLQEFSGVGLRSRGITVPDGEDPNDTEFKEASSQLDQGLKSCRSVLNNYRAILADDHADNDNKGSPESNIGDDASTGSPEDDAGQDETRG